MSHTHTHLCQPSFFTHHLSHTISHTPSLTHIFVNHHLSHTIFHTPSFTHTHTIFHTSSLPTIFVNHHLSHTIFHTPSLTHLCQPPSFTHHLGDIHRGTLRGRRGHGATSTSVSRGRRGTWRHPTWFRVAGVALSDIHLRFAWQAWHLETSTCVLRGRRHLAQPLCHIHLSHTIFVRHCLSHNFVTHHLSPTTLSPTIFHTTFSHTIFHTQLVTHNFVTHHLSHTTFHTQLCHTPSFTHNFVTHHLSHTTLSHTIFHTELVTHNFVAHNLSHDYMPGMITSHRARRKSSQNLRMRSKECRTLLWSAEVWWAHHRFDSMSGKTIRAWWNSKKAEQLTHKQLTIHTCMHTYIHTFIHTCIHAYIPTYLHTYIPTYLHTYIPTCLHAYMHTYMHTYVCTYVHTIFSHTTLSHTTVLTFRSFTTSFVFPSFPVPATTFWRSLLEEVGLWGYPVL